MPLFRLFTSSSTPQHAIDYITSRYSIGNGSRVIVLGGDGTFLRAVGTLLSGGLGINDIERNCEWIYNHNDSNTDDITSSRNIDDVVSNGNSNDIVSNRNRNTDNNNNTVSNRNADGIVNNTVDSTVDSTSIISVVNNAITCNGDVLTFYVYNYGHLGYLCPLSKNDITRDISTFKYKDMLLSRVKDKGYFVNELVISRGYVGRVNTFEIHISSDTGSDIQTISTRCDSIIVSTSTGSSAYNASAGGPLLHMHAHVITFVNPLVRTSPVVVGMDRTVEVRILHRNGVGVIDGTKWFYDSTFVVSKGDNIRIAYTN